MTSAFPARGPTVGVPSKKFSLSLGGGGGGGGGGDDGGEDGPRMGRLDLSKISFAAMGGSAEPLHLPENDDAYDVDSSDEDLDGMEAAVARFEARARELAREAQTDLTVGAFEIKKISAGC